MRELSEATIDTIEDALIHYAHHVEIWEGRRDHLIAGVKTALDEFQAWRAKAAEQAKAEQPTELDMENARKSGSPFLSEQPTEPGESCPECDGHGFTVVQSHNSFGRVRCPDCNGTGRAKGGEHGE